LHDIDDSQKFFPKCAMLKNIKDIIMTEYLHDSGMNYCGITVIRAVRRDGMLQPEGYR
jgi:hypothetical protein